MIYGVYLKGGSIGEVARREASNEPVRVYRGEGSKTLAQQDARRRNRMLTPGERSYYKLRYTVRAIA